MQGWRRHRRSTLQKGACFEVAPPFSAAPPPHPFASPSPASPAQNAGADVIVLEPGPRLPPPPPELLLQLPPKGHPLRLLAAQAGLTFTPLHPAPSEVKEKAAGAAGAAAPQLLLPRGKPASAAAVDEAHRCGAGGSGRDFPAGALQRSTVP